MQTLDYTGYNPLTRREVQSPPVYIYYGSTDEEVMEFQSKYPVSDASTTTTTESNCIMETNHATHSIQNAIQELTSIKAQQEEVKQEIAELRGLIKDLVAELRASRVQPQ